MFNTLMFILICTFNYKVHAIVFRWKEIEKFRIASPNYRLETESSSYLKGIVCYYFQSNFPEFK